MTQNQMISLSAVDLTVRRKGLLISPELCTACRGCQVACKQWNQLPGEETTNRGTFENPPDLSASTYNRIRFVEKKNGAEWLFVSQRCLHCGDPGCMKICPAPGALSKHSSGAVVFNKAKCIGCKLCTAGCPFNIPRFDANSKIAKCHLCYDRIEASMPPLCAQTCPTGAIAYGDRDDLVKKAKAAGYKSVYGESSLAGLGVVYALKESPEYYGYNGSPGLPATVALWRNVLKPLTAIGLGAVVAGAFLHYLTIGPSEVSEEEGGERK